ncbi:MAG: LamG-like jellyroll fold domain-containing protein [bacterium]
MQGKSFVLGMILFLGTATLCQGEGGTPSAQVADRTLLNAPVLFTKRFNYQSLHIYDTFYQWHPGGGLYVLENPAEPQEKHRIRTIIDASTKNTLGEGMYFDPSLSYDAKKLLFCFKGQHTGNSIIYEINVDGTGLRQVTNLDHNGNPYKGSGGGHHDVKPCYLPDGRIIFTSTRYSGLVPCANNGVAILHVMNADGSDIHTISVNNVTEFDPCVMPDGRIIFGRWEYVDRNALVIQSLWTILPDGRNETALFANNMVFPEAVLQAKPVPGDDALVVASFTPHNAPPRGTIAMIDTRVGKNDPAAIINFESPANPTHDRGESCDPWALNAHVVLYSGIPQEKEAPSIAVETPGFRRRNTGKLNALMLIDRSGKKIVIHSDPAIDLHNPIPLVPRSVPRTSLDMTDRTKTSGAFFVNDVYVSMPTVKRGTIKWLRVLEETSRVSGTAGGNGFNQTFSISAALAWSAKIFHGMVPVEEDGSVYFEAPSGRALYFQLLDKDYKMVRGMRTFIQAAPGTTRSCAGCHEYAPKAMGMPRLTDRKPKQLKPESWGTGWVDYTRLIQPIWDAKCVSCHGGENGMAKGLDLSAGWTEVFNISYENLTARREKMYTADMVGGICGMNGTAYWSCKVFGPYEHGSGKAILADTLLKPTHSELLTKAEKELVFAWMDSNAMYAGTWDYTLAPPRLPAYPKTVNALKGAMKEAGCVSCHADDKGVMKRFDNWINFDKPEMSTILRAPLPQSFTAKGGYGLALCRDHKVDPTFSRRGVFYGFGYLHSVLDLDKFPTQVWPTRWPAEGKPVTTLTGTSDAHYQKMLAIIRAGRTEMLAKPRIDMPYADLVGNGIMPGRARQILPQDLPNPLPEVKAVDEVYGFVRLNWESSARMIGLIAEIHRGTKAKFKPDATTLIGRTERSTLCDTNPPAGTVHYAVVFVSDPAETCGTIMSGAVYDYQHKPEPAAMPAGQRCPLADFKPRHSEPIWVSHETKARTATQQSLKPRAEPGNGSIALSWDAQGVVGLERFDIYGQSEEGTIVKLNKTPLTVPAFTDSKFHQQKKTQYVVILLAPTMLNMPPKKEDASWVTAQANPPQKEPIFKLAPHAAGLTLEKGASFTNSMLEIKGESCAVITSMPAFNGNPFSGVMEIYFDEMGKMPVILGMGGYMGAGWLLQSIGHKWRFHLGGVSCDGGAITTGKWTRVIFTFDGTTARIYQDGNKVGEAAVTGDIRAHSDKGYIGQYTASLEPPYQFTGKIRLLEIYARVIETPSQ